MTEIVVRYEDKIIERVITEKKRISIGRNSDNDIVLDNRGVSRQHAVIEVNAQNAVIIDNESLNGTFVNNRRVEEEVLRDDDVVTIGKYSLTFRPNASDPSVSELDGTMVLRTKKQRERLETDRRDRDVLTRAGTAAVLMAEGETDAEEIRLGGATVTFGTANFVNVRVRGWFVPDIQAKITPQDAQYVLTNVGHRQKTRVNGVPVDEVVLKNSDLVQIGRSVFRFICGGA